jgi:acylphosphatase
MVRKRVVILGEVQGVYFRDTCRHVATEQQVSGWIRNQPDGTVEAVFEGEADRVERVVGWTHRGPRGAMVDTVEVYDEEPEGISGFAILPTPWRADWPYPPRGAS